MVVIVLILVIFNITGVMMKVGVLSVIIIHAHRLAHRAVLVLYPVAEGQKPVALLILVAAVPVVVVRLNPAIPSVVL
mgnify:CR=1 FL=1